MMYGMFGFGWLMMLAVIGLPLLLIFLLVGAASGWFQNWNRTAVTNQNQPPAGAQPVNYALPAQKADRYCSHCGAGLKADWTHCPQCGAPIG
jgi:uncharacterized paraquat-inducible protein A